MYATKIRERESQETQMLYGELTEDIRYAKRLQWAIPHYMILILAAIIGFIEVMGIDCNNPINNGVWVLILIPFFVNCYAIYHLVDIHSRMFTYRMQLNYLINNMTRITKNILLGKEPKFNYYFYSLTLPFIIMIIISFCLFSLYLYFKQLIDCYYLIITCRSFLVIASITTILTYQIKKHKTAKDTKKLRKSTN